MTRTMKIQFLNGGLANQVFQYIFARYYALSHPGDKMYLDEERVLHRKRPVMAPGEMEDVKLRKEELLKHPDLKTITVKLEEI